MVREIKRICPCCNQVIKGKRKYLDVLYYLSHQEIGRKFTMKELRVEFPKTHLQTSLDLLNNFKFVNRKKIEKKSVHWSWEYCLNMNKIDKINEILENRGYEL